MQSFLDLFSFKLTVFSGCGHCFWFSHLAVFPSLFYLPCQGARVIFLNKPVQVTFCLKSTTNPWLLKISVKDNFFVIWVLLTIPALLLTSYHYSYHLLFAAVYLYSCPLYREEMPRHKVSPQCRWTARIKMPERKGQFSFEWLPHNYVCQCSNLNHPSSTSLFSPCDSPWKQKEKGNHFLFWALHILWSYLVT